MRDIDDYVDKYINEPFESTMVDIRKRMIIGQCNEYKHDNILEIGCGMSPFFLDFKDYKRMVIVEPGEKFIENAKAFAEEENSNIDIILGFLEEQINKIKALEISFDFIILSSVLHELDEPQKMLAAIRELCTEETVVHINVPNANSLHRLIASEMGIIDDVHEQSAQMQRMQRRRTYDTEMLKKDIENAGFSVKCMGTYFVKPFTHAQMQQCMDEGIIDQNVITGLEKLIKYIPEVGAGIYVDAMKNGRKEWRD